MRIYDHLFVTEDPAGGKDTDFKEHLNPESLVTLTGCRVETIDGRLVGQVERVELGTGTPTLVVNGARGEAMVPLAEDIGRRVDVAARLIVIDPPAGLLELNGGPPPSAPSFRAWLKPRSQRVWWAGLASAAWWT